jgi:hypothetical protein
MQTMLIYKYAELYKQGYTDIDTDFETSIIEYCEWFEPLPDSRKKQLPRLLPIYRKLPGELFWRAFGCTWAWCYDTWPHRRPLLSLLNRHHRCSPARKHDDEEPITIYRGCSSRRVRAVSWTTNRRIAEEFAAGHLDFKVPNPVIATAQIERKDVFDYDNGQDEDEVIANPAGLRCLEVKRPSPRELESYKKRPPGLTG